MEYREDWSPTLKFYFPFNYVAFEWKDLNAAVNIFNEKWPNDMKKSPKSFYDELKMSRRNLFDSTEDAKNVPNDFISSLDFYDRIYFPSKHNLLKNYSVISITTATAEMPFSTLQYLKNYLRNTISVERLNGPALLFIHKDIKVNPGSVINEMAWKSRRLILK